MNFVNLNLSCQFSLLFRIAVEETIVAQQANSTQSALLTEIDSDEGTNIECSLCKIAIMGNLVSLTHSHMEDELLYLQIVSMQSRIAAYLMPCDRAYDTTEGVR